MKTFAVLVGDAPDDYRQKKVVETYNYLTSKEGGSIPGENIIIFPNGVLEILLEATLNDVESKDPDEVLLYFFAKSEADLNAISEYECVGYGKLPIIRNKNDEIRKEVIEYYEKIFKEEEIELKVFYEVCSDFVSEEELGYEKV